MINAHATISIRIVSRVDGVPTNIIGFDANNDGFKDIAAAFGSRIVIRINNKNGDFSETEQFISLSDLYGIEESLLSDTLIPYGAMLAVLDINLDGYQDLVVVHAEGVSIFLNDTTGKLNHLKNIKIAGFPRDDIRVVYVSDLDGDSLPEIIISAVGSHVIYFAEDMSVDMVSLTNQFDVLEPSDVDLDGDIDLTELDVQIFDPCNDFQAPVFKTYWINNGNGVFEKTTSLPTENINTTDVSVVSDVGNQESGAGTISFQYLLTLFTLLLARNLIIRPS